jgi:ABC-type multidrug transport system permease subunit
VRGFLCHPSKHSGVRCRFGMLGLNWLTFDASRWWIWGYYIGFHTYSFEIFMWNEFHDWNTPVLQVCVNTDTIPLISLGLCLVPIPSVS